MLSVLHVELPHNPVLAFAFHSDSPLQLLFGLDKHAMGTYRGT